MTPASHPSAPPTGTRLGALPASSVTHVTQPFMPPLEEYIPFLETIWSNRWLTNCGPFHEELEARLESYLGVPHVSLVANGTIALWLALQALRVGGEVITTPFTFVATAHALRLVGATPVFVDVDPATGNLDPAAIEAAITSRTTAILPVHCFGQPCDTAGIESIAAVYDLKVLYDAAHAFGVRQGNETVLRRGDMSVLSFHATKVFNTLEGGAIVSLDRASKERVDRLRNFGFHGDTTIATPSMNGKMNELQAAFGLLQLRYVDQAIATRASIAARYRAALLEMPGVEPFAIAPSWTMNHSYFPVMVESPYPIDRDALWRRLQAAGILARRYFHPLVSDMPGYRELPSASAPLINARHIAAHVLCLPLHPGVTQSELDRTLQIIADG